MNAYILILTVLSSVSSSSRHLTWNLLQVNKAQKYDFSSYVTKIGCFFFSYYVTSLLRFGAKCKWRTGSKSP